MDEILKLVQSGGEVVQFWVDCRWLLRGRNGLVVFEGVVEMRSDRVGEIEVEHVQSALTILDRGQVLQHSVLLQLLKDPEAFLNDLLVPQVLLLSLSSLLLLRHILLIISLQKPHHHGVLFPRFVATKCRYVMLRK